MQPAYALDINIPHRAESSVLAFFALKVEGKINPEMGSRGFSSVQGEEN